MIPINLPLCSLVLVTWVDSNYVIGWRPPGEETAKLPQAMTSGFVTALNDELIEVSSSIGRDGAKLNPLSIPRISVIAIETLRERVPEPEREPDVHDLPETVESDAEFNFRQLQMDNER